MKKLLSAMAMAATALGSQAATVNVTSTGNYGSLQNYTSCTTVPASLCANFLATNNVSGTFTTAGALPASASSLEIGSSVTSYSFSNGLETVSSSDSGSRLNTLRISTDASGNITAVNIMQAVKWLTGTAPHSTADRFSAFVVAGTNGTSTHNSGCSTLGTGNSGVTDTCLTATITDTSRSTANNSPVAVAMAAPPAPTTSATVPTMSEWGLIFMSSILAMFGIARMRRRQH